MRRYVEQNAVIGIFNTHTEAEKSVKKLQRSGNWGNSATGEEIKQITSDAEDYIVIL